MGHEQITFAETYIAGQVGITLPLKNTGEAEVSGGALGSGTSASNLVFKNSVAGGARLGHYLASIPWLGFSTEVYYSTPNLKQQTVLATPPGSAPSQNVPISGQSMRAITWSNNLEFRMPGGQFEPYGGLGLAVLFATLHDGATGTSRSTTSPGLNVYAGGRYRFGEHFSFFGEAKYNYIPVSFDPEPGLVGLSTNYTAFNLMVGVGYHF
jgi:opacity protein-like surface antigen